MEKKATRKQWEERIADYRASGLGAREWCEAHDLKPHRLWYWIRRLEPKHTQQVDQTSSVTWIPVEMGDAQSTRSESALRVRIGKAVVELEPGFDPNVFSSVIGVLLSKC